MSRQGAIRLAAIAMLVTLLVPHALFLLQPFFMDEHPILRNVLNFFSEKTLVPVDAKYPTFFSYLVAPFVAVGAFGQWVFDDGTGGLNALIAFNYVIDPFRLILPARGVSLVLLIGSGLVSYIAVKRHFGRSSAFLVFILLLSSPAFLEYGAYALPDVAVLFFCLLSLIFCARFVEVYPVNGKVGLLILAAAAAGLAISTKYNAASSVFPIGTAIVWLVIRGQMSSKKGVGLVVVTAAICIAAFLAASPGWFLSTQFFWEELMGEVQHAKRGHLGATGVPVLGNLELLLVHAPLISVFSVIGIIAWLKQRDALGALALSAVVANLVMAATSAKQSLHYMYPSIAGMLVLSSYAVTLLGKQSRLGLASITVLVFLGGMANGLRLGKVYLEPNTTAMASMWINENIPAGTLVARDWAYVPELYSRETLAEKESKWGWGQRNGESVSAYLQRNYKVLVIADFEHNAAWLRNTQARYFVTSSAMYERFFEYGLFTRRMPDVTTEFGRQFHDQREFYAKLFNSDRWREVYSINTGNGPATHVFRREY